MNYHVNFEIFIQLIISFGVGTTIGVEREYRTKAAGLRTMIMICLGSTIFTQLSMSLGGQANGDRIAASIVSGIGFLGAGVIFKDGLNVSGLTTATTIWITASLGMAIGAGEYFIGTVGSVVVLIVLILFEKIKLIIERLHQSRTYKITIEGEEDLEKEIKTEIKRLHLQFQHRRNLKQKKHSIMVYEVFGSESRLDEFSEYLRLKHSVRSYEY